MKIFLHSKRTLSVAESCTGGLLGGALTQHSGASKYFKGGVICYHDDVKRGTLKIPATDLKKYGAVSAVVAKKMAESVRRLVGSDYGLAVTGVAGPTGGAPDKPVGLVFIALATSKKTFCKKFIFKGSRADVRKQAVNKALSLLVGLF